MDKPELVVSKPAGPEKESWYHYRLKEEQETPKRLEDAAKFLASMISVSLSIFLSVSGKSGFPETRGVTAALVMWILSLILSFFVLFPFRYRFSADSVKSFRGAHRKIVAVKRFLLTLSLVLFALALIALIFIFL